MNGVAGLSFQLSFQQKDPNTLTMMDLLEVNTFKLMDCNKAHYDKEIVQ